MDSEEQRTSLEDHNEPRCPRSKNHEGKQPHVCPFRWEINDDDETLCTCCDDCTQECADDI
jgi:hypothetical protein